MAEMREVLTKDGVVMAVELTEENAADIAQMTGGVALYRGEQADEVFAVRIPTLWGNVEAEIGHMVLKNLSNGRYFVQTPEQYHEAYFDEISPEILEKIRNAPPAEKPVFESEEDLQAHTSRNLFEERQRYTKKEN